MKRAFCPVSDIVTPDALMSLTGCLLPSASTASYSRPSSGVNEKLPMPSCILFRRQTSLLPSSTSMPPASMGMPAPSVYLNAALQGTPYMRYPPSGSMSNRRKDAPLMESAAERVRVRLSMAAMRFTMRTFLGCRASTESAWKDVLVYPSIRYSPSGQFSSTYTCPEQRPSASGYFSSHTRLSVGAYRRRYSVWLAPDSPRVERLNCHALNHRSSPVSYTSLLGKR